ncbi:hypothetical protein JTE90_002735 [Oedothorax gibbosus]|uniref:Uncharacterized protein n=1 Tax=Oedothorax gibbosus TaxID=931172 RepID=A0AAV6VWL0_9ARAC|nr:hypothetical protein JTE90_002735 [Oedothorax gibbosus]
MPNRNIEFENIPIPENRLKVPASISLHNKLLLQIRPIGTGNWSAGTWFAGIFLNGHYLYKRNVVAVRYDSSRVLPTIVFVVFDGDVQVARLDPGFVLSLIRSHSKCQKLEIEK